MIQKIGRPAAPLQLDLEPSSNSMPSQPLDPGAPKSTGLADRIFNDPTAWIDNTKEPMEPKAEANLDDFFGSGKNLLVASPRSSANVAPNSATPTTASSSTMVSIKPFTRKYTLFPSTPSLTSADSSEGSFRGFNDLGSVARSSSWLLSPSPFPPTGTDLSVAKPELPRVSRLSMSFFWSEKNLFRALPSPMPGDHTPITPGAFGGVLFPDEDPLGGRRSARWSAVVKPSTSANDTTKQHRRHSSLQSRTPAPLDQDSQLNLQIAPPSSPSTSVPTAPIAPLVRPKVLERPARPPGPRAVSKLKSKVQPPPGALNVTLVPAQEILIAENSPHQPGESPPSGVPDISPAQDLSVGIAAPAAVVPSTEPHISPPLIPLDNSFVDSGLAPSSPIPDLPELLSVPIDDERAQLSDGPARPDSLTWKPLFTFPLRAPPMPSSPGEDASGNDPHSNDASLTKEDELGSNTSTTSSSTSRKEGDVGIRLGRGRMAPFPVSSRDPSPSRSLTVSQSSIRSRSRSPSPLPPKHGHSQSDTRPGETAVSLPPTHSHSNSDSGVAGTIERNNSSIRGPLLQTRPSMTRLGYQRPAETGQQPQQQQQQQQQSSDPTPPRVYQPHKRNQSLGVNLRGGSQSGMGRSLPRHPAENVGLSRSVTSRVRTTSETKSVVAMGVGGQWQQRESSDHSDESQYVPNLPIGTAIGTSSSPYRAGRAPIVASSVNRATTVGHKLVRQFPGLSGRAGSPSPSLSSSMSGGGGGRSSVSDDGLDITTTTPQSNNDAPSSVAPWVSMRLKSRVREMHARQTELVPF